VEKGVHVLLIEGHEFVIDHRGYHISLMMSPLLSSMRKD
jgi:hypothetical protein